VSLPAGTTGEHVVASKGAGVMSPQIQRLLEEAAHVASGSGPTHAAIIATLATTIRELVGRPVETVPLPRIDPTLLCAPVPFEERLQ
jgi:hypothetical protein